MEKPTILTINNGFYFFGSLLDNPPEGFIAMKDVSMFGDFSGGKGMPGVARGDKDAKVTLDRFMASSVVTWPINAVCSIAPSIDLYKFSGTTER